jgi:hypothetical protein
MATQPADPGRQFLRFLFDHPNVRSQIRAPADRTLLYSGDLGTVNWNLPMPVTRTRTVWESLVARRARGESGLEGKLILPDVLARIVVPSETGHATLLAYVEAVQPLVPWRPMGFKLWEALSGIFAANATGKVSFVVGQGVTGAKVFASTEVRVLMRNPNVDPVAKDLLAFYLRCIEHKQTAINVSLLTA